MYKTTLTDEQVDQLRLCGLVHVTGIEYLYRVFDNTKRHYRPTHFPKKYWGSWTLGKEIFVLILRNGEVWIQYCPHQTRMSDRLGDLLLDLRLEHRPFRFLSRYGLTDGGVFGFFEPHFLNQMIYRLRNSYMDTTTADNEDPAAVVKEYKRRRKEQGRKKLVLVK